VTTGDISFCYLQNRRPAQVRFPEFQYFFRGKISSDEKQKDVAGILMTAGAMLRQRTVPKSLKSRYNQFSTGESSAAKKA